MRFDNPNDVVACRVLRRMRPCDFHAYELAYREGVDYHDPGQYPPSECLPPRSG